MNYIKEESRIYFNYMFLDASALSLTLGKVTSKNMTGKLMKACSYNIPLQTKILYYLTKHL